MEGNSEKILPIPLDRYGTGTTFDLENNYRSKTAKKFTAFSHFVLAFKSLGIVYGDIGTSPLYTFSGLFDGPPQDYRDVYGSISLLVWSLTIIPLIKYVLIALQADDNGEGGTFALYSLIARHTDLGVREEKRQDDLNIPNYNTVSAQNKTHPERKKAMKKALASLAIAGVAFVLGDGVLTPAISVISAVEGLEIPFPGVSKAIAPISIVILIFLFLAQRFGTDKVSKAFSPIMALWMVSLAVIGIWNISQNPDILRALNPWFAIDLFIRNGTFAFNSLGGVLLALTGVEALYADMGHFSRSAIRISFPCFVYIPLCLNYLGQGARVALEPELISNAYWLTIPQQGGIYWAVFVLAILATIIASQALISASFTVIYQATKLDCFPNVKVTHTSDSQRGQVYIPEINYLLMVLVVITCIIFPASAKLTTAFGVAVVSVMFITTCLLAIVINVVWHWNIIFSILYFIVFGLIDATFFASTIQKVKNGGWFTLMIAFAFGIVMGIWKYGTTLRLNYELKHKLRVDDLFIPYHNKSEGQANAKFEDISADTDPSIIIDDKDQAHSTTQEGHNADTLRMRSNHTQRYRLQLAETGRIITRLPGIGMFYQDASLGVPITFTHFIQHLPAVPETLAFISIRPVAVPYVGEESRFVVQRVRCYEGVYRVVARYGYMEKVTQSGEFIDRLVDAIISIDPGQKCLKTFKAKAKQQVEIEEQKTSSVTKDEPDNAKQAVTYVLEQQELLSKPENSFVKSVVLSIYMFLVNNSHTVYRNWDIPPKDIITVGMTMPL